MKRLSKLSIVALLCLVVSLISTSVWSAWKYNPFTHKSDYYQTATELAAENTTSGLTETTVQGQLDEIASLIGSISTAGLNLAAFAIGTDTTGIDTKYILMENSGTAEKMTGENILDWIAADGGFESHTSNDIDPDRLAGDSTDDNLIDSALLDATLADIADGTIAENLVNTANPWADNEVSDTITVGASGSVNDAAIPAGITRDTEWNTVAKIETATSANIIINTEIDTASELNALTTDTDMVLDTDIGSTVQAYNASLAAIAAGTWTGANSITTLGTIATGVWNGTKIDADYIDILAADDTLTDRDDTDYILLHDSSGVKSVKMTVGNFVSGLGGTGSSITLDLADDGSNESTGVTEIATTGTDTNSIFTEPSANKLLINIGADWPKADQADVALTGDSATSFFSTGTLEIARGGTGASLTDPNADRILFWDDSETATGLLTADTNHFSISTTTISLAADGIDATLVDWGSGENQIDLDDVPDSATYQKVAAGSVNASAAVDLLTDSDATGAIQVTGLSATRAKTFSDAAATVMEQATSQGGLLFGDSTPDTEGEIGYASDAITYYGSASARILMNLEAAQKVSGDKEIQDNVALSFGNDNDWEITYDEATSDALEFTHTAGAGADVTFDLNDNAADSTYTITNSDGTYEANLTVEGDITCSGAITSNAAGDSYLALANNAGGLAASGYRIYFETDSTDVLSYSVNGSEKRFANLGDAQTFTGIKTFSSGIIFAEEADHASTPSAGYGYLWVKSDTPSSLIFTDDAGTDYDLTAASSGDVESVGDCTSGAALDGSSDGGSYIRIYDGDSHYGEFQVPDISGNVTYTFPAATSTIATLQGSDTQVIFNNGGTAYAGDAGFVFNSTTDTLTLGENGVDGILVLYNESGGTDYNLIMQPGTQSAAATITFPGSTSTLATLGLAETFSGAKTFSAALTLDDGSGASPDFIMKDATDETATFSKVDSGYLTITTAAADGVNVLVGNLKVGDGSPGQTINGEDVYVNGLVEIDGVLYADGGITSGGTVALAANSLTMTGSIAATGDRVTKGWFTDIESTNMPTVGGTALFSAIPATLANAAASTWTLADGQNAALAIRSDGANDIIKVTTTNSSEGVSMGYTLTVTGATTLTGGIASIGAASNLSGGTVTLGTLAGTIDAGGATSLEIPNSDDPDVDAAGEISWDTDGWMRAYDGSAQVAIARKLEEIHVTVVAPNDLADAVRDKFVAWSNESGMSFIVTGWKAWSGTDNTELNIEEYDADGQNNETVDAVNIQTDGTGIYTASDTSISGATIENGHLIALDFDDTDEPGYVKVTIYGYYAADVN